MAPELIVWDFDGVLNRNVVDGRFIWADNLEADLGLSQDSLQNFLFRSGRMRSVISGDEDLRDVVAEWLVRESATVAPDAFLDYWFAHDAHPDAEVMEHLNAHPARHVVGTNNEARRAAYIEQDMGFDPLVERVFASGRMGCAKPETIYFETISTWSGIALGATLLVDDSLANVEAAQTLGWRAFHFTDASRDGLADALQ